MADEQPDLEEEKTEVQTSDTETPELDVPPTVPPPLTTEFHEHDGPRWPTIIAYLVAALIVAALVVLIARAIYHASHKNNKPKPSPTTNEPAPGAGSQTKKIHKPPKTTANNSAVPNTGPGNTAAMFVGVSLAAAGLHYIVSLRRAR